MTDNPYQSPDEALPIDRAVLGLHWYHLPFIVAAVCGLALAVIANMTFVSQNDFALCVTLAFAILVVDLPLCGLLLWEWCRTGEPPKFYLEHPFNAECRALRRALDRRLPLDDEAFYATFYANSGVAKDVVIGVRREMRKMLGRLVARVHPQDDLGLLEPYVDFADVFDELGDTFAIVIPWRTGAIDIDGTFDSLVRLIADCVERRDKG